MRRSHIPILILLWLGITRASFGYLPACLEGYTDLQGKKSSAIPTSRKVYRASLEKIEAHFKGMEDAKTKAIRAYKEIYNKVGPVLVKYVFQLLKEANTQAGTTKNLRIAFKSDDGRLIFDLAKAMLERKGNPFPNLTAETNLVLLEKVTDRYLNEINELKAGPKKNAALLELDKELAPLKGNQTILGGIGGTVADGGMENFFLSGRLKGGELKVQKLAFLGSGPGEVQVTGVNTSSVIFDIRYPADNDKLTPLFKTATVDTNGERPIDSYLRRMGGYPEYGAKPTSPLKAGESPPITQVDRLAALDLARTVEFKTVGDTRVPPIRDKFQSYVAADLDGKNPDPGQSVAD